MKSFSCDGSPSHLKFVLPRSVLLSIYCRRVSAKRTFKVSIESSAWSSGTKVSVSFPLFSPFFYLDFCQTYLVFQRVYQVCHPGYL